MTEEKRDSVTLEQAKTDVAAAGFTPSAGSWEDEYHVYAFSAEGCGPATYGHSKFAAHFYKASGWYVRG